MKNIYGSSSGKGERGFSRRGFLRYAGAGALAGLLSASQSYAGETPKPDTHKPAKPSALENEADRTILSCPFRLTEGEQERAVYNELSVKYMDLLMKKGKYDPKKKQHLKDFFNFNIRSPKANIEYMQRQLLREQDPEAYLKKYILPDTVKKIRQMKIDPQYVKFFPYKIDPEKPDLSDQIFLYEFQEGLETLSKGLHKNPKIPSTQPLSGNSTVR